MSESQETSDFPTSLDTFVTLTDKEDLSEASDLNKIKAALLAAQTTIQITSRRVGTSFPSSPAEGDSFYRSDENTLYAYNGSDWISVSGGSLTGIPTNIQVFTASGTWTKPAGVSIAYVKAWGRGGAGGGGINNTSTGGGGGGGGYSEGLIAVTGNVTVTIDDTSSRFAGTTTLTANKGSAGSGVTSGSGGAASNGTINLTGQAGQNGAASITRSGGVGGGSPFGDSGGGGSPAYPAAGQAGALPGGGGGGGGAESGNNSAGGAGGGGLVIVMY